MIRYLIHTLRLSDPRQSERDDVQRLVFKQKQVYFALINTNLTSVV